MPSLLHRFIVWRSYICCLCVREDTSPASQGVNARWRNPLALRFNVATARARQFQSIVIAMYGAIMPINRHIDEGGGGGKTMITHGILGLSHHLFEIFHRATKLL